MKHRILLITLFFLSTFCVGQTPEQEKLDKWLSKHDIELNKPVAPSGFIQTTDCKSRPLYRMNRGDTIVLYHAGSSIAQDLKTFKKTVTDPDYNVFIFPSKTQNNGTVIVNHLIKSTFIWRNDTLYLGDDYNKNASEATGKALSDFLNKRITQEEYRTIASSYVPMKERFKVIYYTGLFSAGRNYQFTEAQNFRKESIVLVNRWLDGELRMSEVNLKTHTNGRYRFSGDMSILETTNCYEK